MSDEQEHTHSSHKSTIIHLHKTYTIEECLSRLENSKLERLEHYKDGTIIDDNDRYCSFCMNRDRVNYGYTKMILLNPKISLQF